MNIPFIADMGMEQRADGLLFLPFNNKLLNHVGTIHGSVLFTLAETQSGFYLGSCFPQYKGKIVPLLRASTVKYKNPANKDVYAKAFTSQESLEKFEAQFLKKGRAIIRVDVEVLDSDNVLVMVGEFVWFISKID